MPRTKGAKQFAYELPERLVDDFRQFAAARGRTVTDELADALRRHMAYPSAVPVMPLTPFPDTPLPEVRAPAPPPPAGEKGKRKGKK